MYISVVSRFKVEEFIQIDEDDWRYLDGKKLSIASSDRVMYCLVKVDEKWIRIHRYIMEKNGHDINGKFIDHKNHDGLDNRKSNLRVCNNAENTRNSRKQLSETSSIYKGVSWNKNWQKWEANIKYNFKKIGLYTYDDEVLAAKAYDQAAAYFFGEFADLNFPNEPIDDLIDMSVIKNKCETDFKTQRRKSPYNGIYLHKSGLWHAEIIINKKKKSLKYHKTPEDAAMAYDEYVINNKLEKYYKKVNFRENYEGILSECN